MNMIQIVFYDQRPNVEKNLHSTNMILSPVRYFFEENMKFCNVLDKVLIGLPQSRITEMSASFINIKRLASEFLRNSFVFESDDVY